MIEPCAQFSGIANLMFVLRLLWIKHKNGCHGKLAVGRGRAMPINRLFSDGKITLRSLSLVERDNDPLSEIVARMVIEIDAAGTHDPEDIAKLAVAQLGIP